MVGITKLVAVSPTLAETLRACFLRAGLSRSSQARSFALESPKSWLGTAYHQVLEEVHNIDLAQDHNAQIKDLWTKAVSKIEMQVYNHPLNCRYGSAPSWPGYNLALASATIRAKDIIAKRVEGTSIAKERQVTVYREQEFVAFGGKLRGRPDLVRATEIVDYKSGKLTETNEQDLTEGVKEAYVRQVRIYGFLVMENLGWMPPKAALLPLAGPRIEVELNPADCEREALAAMRLVEEYNEAVQTRTPQDLATPSATSCGWCAYKMLCSKFWQTARADWSSLMDGGVAVEGRVLETKLIHGGRAVAITIEVLGGTIDQQSVRISPFPTVVHPQAETLPKGRIIRITGLRARQDGGLVPTMRTVLIAADNVPSIQAAAVTT